jgi:hypothetical protein
VNIEGECLHFKGKEYTYYVKEGTVDPRTGYISYNNMPQTKVIFSDEDKAAVRCRDRPDVPLQEHLHREVHCGQVSGKQQVEAWHLRVRYG